MALLTRLNYLDLIVNYQTKKFLQNLTTLAPRAGGITLVNGDTFRGTMRLVSETGRTTPPVTDRLKCNADIVRLSDGVNEVFADATNIELIIEPPTNGSSPTHIAFTFNVSSVALTAALAASGTDFIPAFLEMRIQVDPLVEGTPGIATQDIIIVREPVQIYKTSITV